jgi:lipopolysaccharide transport system ATP-binding protein
MTPHIAFDQLTKKFGSYTALDAVSGHWTAGQAIGVVGANGAGKSTLLRLLSGISAPTSGRMDVQGRLASLLEVGTGFHPELTGRENIYLYGQILGLRRSEIRRQLDAVVDFAGVGSQLDLPLKHYSSGQKIRLGFSVAAQLQADILLLDEVLGVGDAAFQQQSFERMQSLLADEGRLVVVVSHHLGTIRRMCGSVLWLDHGRTKQFGPTSEVLDAYQGLDSATAPAPFVPSSWVAHLGWDRPLVAGQPAVLNVHIKNEQPLARPNLRLSLFNQNGEFLAPFSPVTSGLWAGQSWPAHAKIQMSFDRLPLMRGRYHLGLRLTDNDVELERTDVALPFEVNEGLYFPHGDTFAPKHNGVWLAPTWELGA